MGSKRRNDIDWERIKDEFRANQLTLREIAARHNIVASMISRRSKKEGWPRDLAVRVRRETQERLLLEEQQSVAEIEKQDRQQKQRANETVERSVARNVQLVSSHRKDIEQLHRLKRTLATRLEAHLAGEQVDGIFIGDKESPGDLLEKLARVTSRLIPLERQAYNLDGTREENGIDKLLEAIDGSGWKV